MVAGVCATFGAATIGSAGSSHANIFSAQFRSPSGDVSCNLVYYPPVPEHLVGKNFVQCDVANHRWTPPQPPRHGRADATSTFVLVRGQSPIVAYGPGRLATPEQMDDGDTRSAGTITCSSEHSVMRCTDVSTGHFFRVSLESYELG
jgi:hypothetical protein